MAAINAQFNMQLLSDYLARNGMVTANMSPISVEGRFLVQPFARNQEPIVPGFLVIMLMFYPSLLASLVVVREKERGTIFNFYCSPVSRWEVIVGKAVPYVGLAFVDYFLLFALSLFAFKVNFTGNFLVLTGAAFLYITCCIGLGLVISVLCRTQIAAMLITFVSLMTPSMLFSGMITPIASMDPWRK